MTPKQIEIAELIKRLSEIIGANSCDVFDCLDEEFYLPTKDFAPVKKYLEPKQQII